MKKSDKRWDIVHRFEDKLKAKTLVGLGEKESLAIFSDLYDFSRRFVNKRYYYTVNRAKIDTIGRLNAMFMKAAR